MPDSRDFDRMLSETPTRQTPLTEAERRRILAMAYEKVGVQPARRRRPLTVFAAVAAAVCAVSLTAFAAPYLLQMAKGDIGFFQSAPSEAENPLDAPRGETANARTALEAYNAPVGQSVTDAGVTITLDNLSMDAASMDAFFTITGEQAMEGVLDSGSYLPDWEQFWSAGPVLWRGSINGQEGAFTLDSTDFYRADSASVKLWCHFLLNDTPQGDEVTVTLSTPYALRQNGAWSFTVTLDGTQVRAGARQAAPGVYETDVSVLNENEADWVGNFEEYRELLSHVPIRLERLAFGPLGGVIMTDYGDWSAVSEESGVYYSGSTAGLSAQALWLTDSTGKTLPVTYGSASSGYGPFNVALPDPAADSVTLTPVQQDSTTGEMRTYTVEQMKAGAQLATSSLGGYTVQDYQVEGSAITMKLVPYGWPSANPQLMADDDGLISMAQTEAADPDTGETVTTLHSALQTKQVDPRTGVISWRLDYYAATEEQLNAVTGWQLYYEGDAVPDTAHAVTLALE